MYRWASIVQWSRRLYSITSSTTHGRRDNSAVSVSIGRTDDPSDEVEQREGAVIAQLLHTYIHTYIHTGMLSVTERFSGRVEQWAGSVCVCVRVLLFAWDEMKFDQSVWWLAHLDNVKVVRMLRRMKVILLTETWTVKAKLKLWRRSNDFQGRAIYHQPLVCSSATWILLISVCGAEKNGFNSCEKSWMYELICKGS